MLSSLVLIGCSRGEEDDKIVPPSETDAGAIVADATAADAGEAATVDAAVPTAGCEGPDALSALICQLGQGAGVDGGSQAGLQDLIDGLGGLTGILGTSGTGGGLGTGAAPTEEQCRNPADQLTQIRCSFRRDGGISMGGGRFGRGDASVPPPADQEDAAAADSPDAGATSSDDAGAESAEDAAVVDAESAPLAS